MTRTIPTAQTVVTTTQSAGEDTIDKPYPLVVASVGAHSQVLLIATTEVNENNSLLHQSEYEHNSIEDNTYLFSSTNSDDADDAVTDDYDQLDNPNCCICWRNVIITIFGSITTHLCIFNLFNF
jgi:hypothetical protein